MKRLLLAIAFVLALAAPARSYPISQNHVYVNGETLTASIMNPNLQTIYSWANGGVDNTNIGTAGIFASQIIPTSTATATFSSAWGWTIQTTGAAQIALTVIGSASATADLLDVYLGTTKEVWVDDTGALHLTQALSGYVALSPASQQTGSINVSGNITSGGAVTAAVGTTSSAGFAFGTQVSSLFADGVNTLVRAPTSSGSFDVENAAYTATNAQFPDAGGMTLLRGNLSVSSGSITSTAGIAVGGALSGATTGSFSGTITSTQSAGSNVITYNNGQSGTSALYTSNATVAGVSGYALEVGQVSVANLAALDNLGNWGIKAGFYAGQTAGFSMPNTTAGGNTVLGTTGGAVAGISSTAFYVYTPNIAVQEMAVDDSGDVGIAGSYYSASRRALKSNIRPLRNASLLVDRTRIVRYCYKVEHCKPGETRHIGFIADDTPSDLAPKHAAMDVNAVAAVDLAAIQQLQGIVERLRRRVEQLEAHR